MMLRRGSSLVAPTSSQAVAETVRKHFDSFPAQHSNDRGRQIPLVNTVTKKQTPDFLPTASSKISPKRWLLKASKANADIANRFIRMLVNTNVATEEEIKRRIGRR